MSSWPERPASWCDKPRYYQRLMEGLKALIEAKGATNIPLSELNERFVCRGCGACEEHLPSDAFGTLRQQQPLTQGGRWIIIEAKKRDYIYQKKNYQLKTCSFICLSCGLWQISIFKQLRNSKG